MSVSTNIEWCDSTVNVTSGCEEECEIGDRCYAKQIHVTRLHLYKPTMYARDFRDMRFFQGRIEEAATWSDLTGKARPKKPWLDGMPRMIFVSDMSDALSPSVPFEFLRRHVIEPIAAAPQHLWLWLTKQPQQMAAFDAFLAGKDIAWPAHLWAGTSVTTQPTADWRIPELLKVRASVHFISAEPLYAQVDLINRRWQVPVGTPDSHRIDWVITGGESGNTQHENRARRPRPCYVEWIQNVVDDCTVAQVPVFVKQLGSMAMGYPVLRAGEETRTQIPLSDKKGGGADWEEWPEALRRREIPAGFAVKPPVQGQLL